MSAKGSAGGGKPASSLSARIAMRPKRGGYASGSKPVSELKPPPPGPGVGGKKP